jgi:hypothetical protein
LDAEELRIAPNKSIQSAFKLHQQPQEYAGPAPQSFTPAVK